VTFGQAVSAAVKGVLAASRRAWPDTDWAMLSPIPPDADPKAVYVQLDRAEREPLTVRRKAVRLRMAIGRVWKDDFVTDSRTETALDAASSLIAEVESATDCGRDPIVAEVAWDVLDGGLLILTCVVETTVEEGEP
jgi:hypothetical protein